MPDLPSIAVLPFENMSVIQNRNSLAMDHRNHHHALSKVPNVFVIARNSTFTYKGKPVKVKQVSEELGFGMCWKGRCSEIRRPHPD